MQLTDGGGTSSESLAGEHSGFIDAFRQALADLRRASFCVLVCSRLYHLMPPCCFSPVGRCSGCRYSRFTSFQIHFLFRCLCAFDAVPRAKASPVIACFNGTHFTPLHVSRCLKFGFARQRQYINLSCFVPEVKFFIAILILNNSDLFCGLQYITQGASMSCSCTCTCARVLFEGRRDERPSRQ